MYVEGQVSQKTNSLLKNTYILERDSLRDTKTILKLYLYGSIVLVTVRQRNRIENS